MKYFIKGIKARPLSLAYTHNPRRIERLRARHLDTRSDPVKHPDANLLAEILGVSRRTGLNGLALPHWKHHQRLQRIDLERRETLAE